MPAPNVPGTTRTLRYGTAALAEAAALIAAGEPVAVPTETVYGLAADATNPHAVARIYAAKGRPSFNPLIVHVPDVATAETIGVFDADARALDGSRTEERRVGKECVSTCSSRWSPYNNKKNNKTPFSRNTYDY